MHSSSQPLPLYPQDALVLPPGWEMGYTSDMKVFCVGHNSGTTTFSSQPSRLFIYEFTHIFSNRGLSVVSLKIHCIMYGAIQMNITVALSMRYTTIEMNCE